MSTQAGWFVYTLWNGKVNYHKYCMEGDGYLPDTKKYYTQREVEKFPLGEEEYKADLETLRTKYPITIDLDRVKQRRDAGQYDCVTHTEKSHG